MSEQFLGIDQDRDASGRFVIRFGEMPNGRSIELLMPARSPYDALQKLLDLRAKYADTPRRSREQRAKKVRRS